MGFILNLSKENNSLYNDFDNAYWHIENITYTTSQVGGTLKCYPSRSASQKNGEQVTPKLSIGNSVYPNVNACIYRWDFIFPLSSVFENSIPLDKNEQFTAIYKAIKNYTQLPFEDVFEE